MKISNTLLALFIIFYVSSTSAQSLDLNHTTGKPLSGYFTKDENQKNWREDPDKVTEGLDNMPSPQQYMANLRHYGFADYLNKPATGLTEDRDTWSLVGPVGNYGDDARNGRISGIQVISIDDQSPIIFVGAAQGGLWRAQYYNSEGGIWTDIGRQLPNPSVRALAVDPEDDQHIIVGTGDYSRYAGSGMFVTHTGGDSWTEVSTPVTPKYYFKIIYQNRFSNPANQFVIAACSKGLFRSENRGDSWIAASFQDGTSITSGLWSDLVEHPTQPNILYACAGEMDDGTENGMYKSIDFGETWFQLTSPTLSHGDSWRRASMAISRSDPNVLVVMVETGGELDAIYKSVDNGSTWTVITNNLADFGRDQLKHAQAISIHPENPDIILAGGTILARSINGGASWVTGPSLGIDFGHPDITQLYFSPDTENNDLWICNDGGVYRYDSLTMTTYSFIGDSVHGLACTEIDHLDANRDIRAMGLQDNGVILSHDAGQTWLDTAISDGYDVEIYYPATGGIFYIDGVYASPRWWCWRWKPDGTRVHLVKPSGDEKPTITYLPESGKMASHDAQSVYTIDASDGSNWVEIASNLLEGEYVIKNLVSSRAGDETIYVRYLPPHNYEMTILRKQQDGQWATTHLDLNTIFPGQINCLCPSREWPGEFWVGLDGTVGTSKLFHTTDYGVTWENLTGDLGLFRSIRSIEVQPFNPNILFLATIYGVMRSTNGGHDWEPFQDGLPIGSCKELRFVLDSTPEGLHTLELAMDGRGLWTHPIQGLPVVFVDRNATGSELGTREHPYHSFVAGVNGAPTGGIVAVRSNDYHESFVYQKNVVVYTWGGSSTIE